MKRTRLMLFSVAPFFSLSMAAAESNVPVDPAHTWDLTVLYKDDAAWMAAKDKVAAEIPKLQ